MSSLTTKQTLTLTATDHMLFGSMVDEFSSTTTVVPPHHSTVLNGTNLSQNLIILNVNASHASVLPLNCISPTHTNALAQTIEIIPITPPVLLSTCISPTHTVDLPQAAFISTTSPFLQPSYHSSTHTVELT